MTVSDKVAELTNALDDQVTFTVWPSVPPQGAGGRFAYMLPGSITTGPRMGTHKLEMLVVLVAESRSDAASMVYDLLDMAAEVLAARLPGWVLSPDGIEPPASYKTATISSLASSVSLELVLTRADLDPTPTD